SSPAPATKEKLPQRSCGLFLFGHGCCLVNRWAPDFSFKAYALNTWMMDAAFYMVLFSKSGIEPRPRYQNPRQGVFVFWCAKKSLSHFDMRIGQKKNYWYACYRELSSPDSWDPGYP
ncbi:MAG: hypothetical protein WBA28_02765, partial [Microbacteriaceae bacterium]